MSANSSNSSTTYHSPSYANGAKPSSRYSSRPTTHSNNLALDNLIRRELKVSDPNNAQEIAGALLSRYQGTPQATGITREAEGLPFLRTTPMMPAMSAPAETSSDAELKQAMDDVERDLKELTSNAILKDVTPELEGWAMAIRSLMSEAFNSARFALDSSQRDKTFGLRRTLGDYARMARLVGALSSPVVNVNYRNLAQSIDEVTAVLLVMMGESLANVSFNRSRYLLQVPYAELQARRDAVIYALRNFIGSTQEAYGPSEYPRGVDAYRQLYQYLDRQGQGDLRSLLVENELARITDTLISRASHGNVEGLRNLGATAQVEIQRLRRLVLIGCNLAQEDNGSGGVAVSPMSPPFTAFLEALQLFIDGFESSGGFRLLRLARPPILFYGLYGNSGNEQAAEARLIELAIDRNRLAELLDCFLQCGCEPERIKCQIILDKILYDLDRAIDLYTLGTAENREPEFRAVAYSYIIESILQGINIDADNDDVDIGCFSDRPAENVSAEAFYLNQEIRNLLISLRNSLFSATGTTVTETDPFLLPPLTGNDNSIRTLVEQELTIQGDMESRWQDLVRTMASECIPISGIQELETNGNGTRRVTRPQLLSQARSQPRSQNNSSIRTIGVFNVISELIRDALFRATDDGSFEAGGTFQPRVNKDFDIPDTLERAVEVISESIPDLVVVPVRVVSIDSPPTAETGDVIEFIANINNNATEPIVFIWDFGDGTVRPDSQSTTHTYSDESESMGSDREMTVTVTAINPGNQSTAEEPITIRCGQTRTQ